MIGGPALKVEADRDIAQQVKDGGVMLRGGVQAENLTLRFPGKWHGRDCNGQGAVFADRELMSRTDEFAHVGFYLVVAQRRTLTSGKALGKIDKLKEIKVGWRIYRGMDHGSTLPAATRT